MVENKKKNLQKIWKPSARLPAFSCELLFGDYQLLFSIRMCQIVSIPVILYEESLFNFDALFKTCIPILSF